MQFCPSFSAYQNVFFQRHFYCGNTKFIQRYWLMSYVVFHLWTGIWIQQNGEYEILTTMLETPNTKLQNLQSRSSKISKKIIFFTRIALFYTMRQHLSSKHLPIFYQNRWLIVLIRCLLTYNAHNLTIQ